MDQASIHQKNPKELIDDYLQNCLSSRRPTEIEQLKLRLKQKQLVLENVVSSREKKSNKRGKISRKTLSALGLHKISKEHKKYQNFVPLHDLWKNYIRDLYEVRGEVKIQADERILKVDYHGAILSVKDCRCKSYVGLNGIVVKESKNMMTIITTLDELKSIPKKNTLFEIVIHGSRITIYGNAILGRPGERMKGKVKLDYQDTMIVKKLK